MQSKKLAVKAAPALIAVGAASGWVAADLFPRLRPPSRRSAIAPWRDRQPDRKCGRARVPSRYGAPNYRAIVAHNRAAVVGITTDGRVTASLDGQQISDFGQLFGNG